MIKRKLGKLGWEVSPLGFGAMRLPMKNVDGKQIDDEEASIGLIRYSIDHGINYIDTAWFYHGGNSERIVGKALRDGYREKVILVTKSPVSDFNSAEDFDKTLDEQLKKLQTDHLDIYLMHGIGTWGWEQIKKYDLLKRAEKAKAEGKIREIGFSFHDGYHSFEEIVNGYDWAVVQIQFNILDEDFQAGIKGLELAASRNIGIIIMEPLRGGKLAKSSPELDAIMRKYPEKRTIADWCLRYLWNYPQISVVLSGMGNTQMVDENIATAAAMTANSLTSQEKEILGQIKIEIKEKIKVPCTFCKYCMPCPSDVSIPNCFDAINAYAWTKERSSWWMDTYTNKYAHTREDVGKPGNWGTGAELCTECGECLDKCPQGIHIPDELAKISDVFMNGADPDKLFKK